jgi:hypothetical protein
MATQSQQKHKQGALRAVRIDGDPRVCLSAQLLQVR